MKKQEGDRDEDSFWSGLLSGALAGKSVGTGCRSYAGCRGVGGANGRVCLESSGAGGRCV